MAKKKKIRILELSDTVFDIYRNKVKGNEEITYDLARKKLTRNAILSSSTDLYDPHNPDDIITMHHYGFTKFKVINERVVWIKTRTSYPKGWVKDIDKQNELNEILGITE